MPARLSPLFIIIFSFGGLSSHFRDGLRSISQAAAAQPTPPSTDYPAERKIAPSFFLFVRL